MTYWLSKPAENLFKRLEADENPPDIVIVGSGYGAAMAALSLSGQAPRPRIWVLERGEEYVPGDFPRDMGDFPRHVSAVFDDKHYGRRDGLFDFRVGSANGDRAAGEPSGFVGALVGNGLGGGSLINANVALSADDDVVSQWPRLDSREPWPERLARARQRVTSYLADRVHEQGESLPKYQALQRFGAAAKAGTTERVPVAVTFSAGVNAQGVYQPACTNCGNCVSGCNIGAKNSLNMNVWPDVVARGVEIFTGVTVRTLADGADPYRWRVRVVATMDAGADLPDALVHELRCRTLVLAAGTFGSTEILMRTAASSSLRFSAKLGKRLSTNGDSIVAGFGERAPVGAVAPAPSLPGDTAQVSPPVGPTIVGQTWLKSRDARWTYRVQEAAIPFPLRRIFEEITTTQGFVGRIKRSDNPGWYSGSNRYHDVAAVSADLAKHTSTYLVMGRDELAGSVSLGREGVVPVPAPGVAAQPGSRPGYHATLHLRLSNEKPEKGFDATKAFNYGTYLPNPAWEIVPDDLLSTLGAGAGRLGGSVLTVHPLGGCCMGVDADAGVVDPDGRVFKGQAGAHDVHAGLYVLDGAIVPDALGVNPFMTIAATALALADAIPATDRMATAGVASDDRASPAAVPPGRYDALGRSPDAAAVNHVEGTFHERLFLPLAKAAKYEIERHLELSAGRLDPFRTLVVDVDVAIPKLDAWIQQPNQALDAEFCFSGYAAERPGTIADSELDPLVCMGGKVNFGTLYDKPAGPQKFGNRHTAIGARLSKQNTGSGGLPDELNRINTLFQNLTHELMTRWRKLQYTCTSDTKTLYGEKILAYAIDPPNPPKARYDYSGILKFEVADSNPWLTLLNVPFAFGRGFALEERASVDFVRISRGPAPLQIAGTPNMPESVQSVAGVFLFWLRALIQTHLLSFLAYEYSTWRCEEEVNRERLAPASGYADGPRHRKVSYRKRSDEKRTDSSEVEVVPVPDTPARLLRYRPTHDGAHKQPVLLVHGLAQGSEVFLTATIGCNLTQYLLSRGFDVWLLDYRTSAQLVPWESKTFGGEQQTDMDEIAENDIKGAVDRVYELTNTDRAGPEKEGIAVFAHCVGAGCVAMATLGGRLDRPASEWGANGRSKIRALVNHAVTPWLTASRHNRLRANALSLVKDLSWFEDGLRALDPLPHSNPSGMEFLVDAIAASLPWEDEWDLHVASAGEHGANYSRRMCNRMALFYGRLWKHANLAPATHKNMETINGPAPLNVLRQFHYSAIRGRLTSLDDRDVYLDQDRFVRYWTYPTLFLHGNANEVVDVASSRLSAYLLAKIRCAKPDRAAVARRDWSRYANYGVGLQIVNNYGHLDMVFGDHACDHVYPGLADFLENPEERDLAAYREAAAADAPAHRHPSTRPVTGPVISHPNPADDTLRVWAEADEFVTTEPRELQALVKGGKLPRRRHRQLENCWMAEFGDVGKVLGKLAGDKAAGIRLGYESDAIEILRPELSHEDRTKTWRRMLKTVCSEQSPSEPVLELEWHAMPWFQRTFGTRRDDPRDVGIALCFATGSCLYPGTSFERELSDSVFCGLYEMARGRGNLPAYGLDHVLLLGDQIYADATANLFDPASPRERYRHRYQRAFGGADPRSDQGRHAQCVFSHVPSYFAVDDHEFEQGWQGAGDLDAGENFRIARAEAARYLSRHESWGTKAFGDVPLWHDFVSREHPFFVFDTRSERIKQGDPDNRATLVGNGDQWPEFECWVRKQKDGGAPLLFIASGSPMAPVNRAVAQFPEHAAAGDDLLRFPGFLKAIVEELHDYAGHVVWLAGDYHLSAVNELTLGYDDGGSRLSLDVLHVCASGLCAIVPFINRLPAEFLWHDATGPAQELAWPVGGGELTLEVRSQQLVTNAPQHFVRVEIGDADPVRVTISAHGPDAGRSGHELIFEL